MDRGGGFRDAVGRAAGIARGGGQGYSGDRCSGAGRRLLEHVLRTGARRAAHGAEDATTWARALQYRAPTAGSYRLLPRDWRPHVAGRGATFRERIPAAEFWSWDGQEAIVFGASGNGAGAARVVPADR